MAMVEVDENRLKLILINSYLTPCGECPVDYIECHRDKYYGMKCSDTLFAWLTEKPIGAEIEDYRR